MRFKFDNPDQEVFAIYRERADGSLVPHTWEETQEQAKERANIVTELSGEPTQVSKTTRGIYFEDINRS